MKQLIFIILGVAVALTCVKGLGTYTNTLTNCDVDVKQYIIEHVKAPYSCTDADLNLMVCYDDKYILASKIITTETRNNIGTGYDVENGYWIGKYPKPHPESDGHVMFLPKKDVHSYATYSDKSYEEMDYGKCMHNLNTKYKHLTVWGITLW